MSSHREDALHRILSGDRGDCFVIAEIAQAHDGSLGTAHAFIDAVATAGADAVKFQTHIAAAESTLDEPWRVPFSRQDQTRYDYWKRMEFTEAQWLGLAEHARERGLVFLSSPFSVEAVALLEGIGVAFWKVASGEIWNRELLEALWGTRKPLIFSTGMAELPDLDPVAQETSRLGIPFSVLQCTTEYPCPPAHWGLGQMDTLRRRYGCAVGLSDHSGTIYAGLAAAALGADLLEVHVAFSRRMFGPDVVASVTTEELSHLVQGVRQIRDSLRSAFTKADLKERTRPMREIFGRSLALRSDLPAGTVLRDDHLTLKKPGTGIPYTEKGRLVGRRLRGDKPANRLLTWDDLVPEGAAE